MPPPPRATLPAPLLPVAIGVVAGITIDNFIPLPLLGLILILAIGVGFFFIRHRNARIGFAALVIAATGLGMLRHAVADRWIAADHVVRFTQDEPILVHLSGEILTPPEIAEPNPDAKLAFEVGPKTRFILDATALDGTDRTIGVSGRVAVTVKAPVLMLQPGDMVEMTGWLYRPRGPRNPGDYDWALHQRRSGIRAGLVCDHGESVLVVRRAASFGWRGRLADLRRRLRGYVIDPAFDHDDPAAGVVAAMVLAQRSAVARETNEAFIRTGNAHFLAASGMNIAWLVAVGLAVTRVWGMHYRISTLFVAGLIVTYVLIAEPQPSILRAGIGGLLWCLCIFRRDRPNPLNWLACSALVILVIEPMEAFRPGFQFSFLAVLGLLYFRHHVARIFATICLRIHLPGIAYELDPRLYASRLVEPSERNALSSTTPRVAAVIRWIAVRLLILLALSFSAWFVTAPLSCYIFNIFNPWGAFCSFLVAFLALPVTCVGYVAAFLGAVFPSTGALTGPMISVTAHAMLNLVNFLAALPGMAIDGRHPSTAWLIAFYALLFLRVYRPHWITGRRDDSNPTPDPTTTPAVPRWRKHGFKMAAAVLFLWWLIPPRWAMQDRDALQVWMLAVGDGTGTVIELPNGQVLLYDFGTRSAFDAGSAAVSFLQHRGVARIDAVFLSHTDFDHYSGIETIARQFPVGRVILNDHFDRFAPKDSGPRRFLDALSALNIPVETWSGPGLLENTGDVEVKSIWPPPAQERPLWDANETSTVLRLRYQDRSILLTGDISEAAMASLLADQNTTEPRAHSLHADALALPHHGAVVHQTPLFIEAVQPQVAVRSSGQRRGLTTNNIEQIVGRRRYFSTADDGCIRLTIRDGRLTAESMATMAKRR